jgi:HD-GYP domain-containing protein (c-di-GMP phosphodiesterase class II)
MDLSSAESKSQRFELLHRIGVALAKEHDRNRLVETILLEAKRLCNADGGTLYLVEKESLEFAMIHNDSLNIARGGTTGNVIDLPAIPLYDAHGRPNLRNIAARVFHEKQPLHIPDSYHATGFDLSGARAFDERNAYRTVSILAIPLLSSQQQVLAVLQLINATDESGTRIPFHPELQRTVNALAAQAGIELDNQELLEAQRTLLDSFIKLIAEAIDAKSPYTGNHCERVPVLAEMIARSLCDATEGPFAAFNLNDSEWRELRVAAWLHDCGKVTTPVHVMDKATKLEKIFDRIEVVRTRFELLKRDARVAYWQSRAEGKDAALAQQDFDARVAQCDEELAFLCRVNIGGEFLSDADRAQIHAIAERQLDVGGETIALLDADMVDNLQISRGTLTQAERLTINGHMVQTVRMLEKLPFPDDLKRVPEYAGGHHERMDGKGYPKGLFAGDMSIPARALAIADVFEALTACDRPYKKGKTLSESLSIMANMKEHNHLDPDLLDHFVTSKVYLQYAQRFLTPEQIDVVDDSIVVAVKPKPFELPPPPIRDQRWLDFLPEYKRLFPV